MYSGSGSFVALVSMYWINFFSYKVNPSISCAYIDLSGHSSIKLWVWYTTYGEVESSIALLQSFLAPVFPSAPGIYDARNDNRPVNTNVISQKFCFGEAFVPPVWL